MIFWNANGVKKQKTELQHFAEQHKIDIILINETHLKPSDRFTLANYRTYRNDGTGWGGTAILVKYNISHYETPTPALNTVEATTIVAVIDNREVCIASVYNSPSKPIDTTDIDKLLDIKPSAILAGDLNAKHNNWNSKTANTRGNKLNRHCARRGYVIAAPTEPTHFVGNSSDVLDIAIIKDINANPELHSLAELNSDHNPVLLTLHSLQSPNFDATQPRLIRKTDWESYTADVEEHTKLTRHIKTCQELDHTIETLTEQIKQCYARHTTTRPSQIHYQRIPKEILDKIHTKNRIRKIWQKYKQPRIKTLLNKLTKDIKSDLEKHRDESWRDTTIELATHDKSLYHCARRLCNSTRPKNATVLKIDNQVITDPAGQAEAYADSLQSQFQPNPATNPIVNAHIEEQVDTYLDTQATSLPILVTPKEIATEISRLKRNKAPGDDDVTHAMLKHLGKKSTIALANIFNTI